jgi:hypothetical protein
MAAQQTIHYELSNASDLNQLVKDLHETEATIVVVAFRSSERWTISDLELARLVAAARTSGKQLVAEQGAGNVAERAVLAGFRTQAVVSDRPSQSHLDTSTILTRPSDDEEPTAAITSLHEDSSPKTDHEERYDSTANLATYIPIDRKTVINFNQQDLPSTSSEHVPDKEEVQAQPAFSLRPRHHSRSSVFRTVVASPGAGAGIAAQPFPGAFPQPQPVGRQQPSSEAKADDPVEAPPRRWRRFGIAKIAAAILAPLIVLMVVGAMAVYLLPSAEITLVPEEQPVSSSLTYGIAVGSVDYDVSLTPTSLTTRSTAEARREATGERYEPAGTASGLIQITNPLTHDVTVPAGTEIPGANGVTYYTAEDLQIPAADPFGSLAFGSAQVGVYAGVTGPDGNIDAGALTGQLGSELFYTNPDGIGGGWMQGFTVITDDDIDAVRAAVEEELLKIAEDEFMSELPDGFKLVPNSVEIGDPEIDVDGVSGEDGEEVTASGTIIVRAEAYDPEELHQLAGSEADRLLSRQGGNDRILLAETVSIQEPMSLDQQNPAFKIDVEAVTRKIITEAEKDEIVEAVAGMSREEAEAYLAKHPKIDRFQITIEPSWLPDRMPEILTRISVHVSSGDSTASTR